MKKKLLLLGTTLMMTFGLSMNAYAADANETVTFTSDKNLEYSNGGNLGDAFVGMAPGQSKEVTIDVVNKNSITADFYVQTEDIKALEQAVNASGGAYDIKLSMINGSNSTVLYDSTLGGATGSQDNAVGSAEGIAEMKNLEDNTYLATLKNGEQVQLVLDFTMDGESITNATANNYSNAEGQIGFQFLVAYDTEGNRVIVNRKDLVEYQTGSRKQNFVTTVKNVVVAVKTGDTTAIIPMVAILAAGLFLLAVTGKKKKRNGEAS